jgi:carbon-monoxide dehydrogenase large subunit
VGVRDGARPPERRGDRVHRHLAARPGPRDRLRADRGGPPRGRPEQIEVIHGDTGTGPQGLGTYGSRSLSVGGESVVRATDKIIDKVKRIVAHQLEAAPEDVELANGRFAIKGSPDKGLTLAEASGEAYIPENLPEGMEPGLEETAFYDPSNFVFPFGAHACVVEVDAETGRSTSCATSRSTTAGRRSTRC